MDFDSQALQTCLPHAKSRFSTMSTIPISSYRRAHLMGVVRAENSDYCENYGKNTEKDDKFK